MQSLKAELQLPVSQALALFVKVIRKISKRLHDIQKAALSAELPIPSQPSLRVDLQKQGGAMDVDASNTTVGNDEGDAATKALKEKQREMLQSLDLSK